MKRVVLVAGLAAALVWVAVATGAVKHYAGPIQQGGNVAFDTKVKHGKTKRVKSFFFYKLTLTCEHGDPIKVSNDPVFPIPPMKVSHRAFHGSFYKADFKTRGEVDGTFTDHYRKAHGTLRVHGRPFGASRGKCDTGTVDWTASKQ